MSLPHYRETNEFNTISGIEEEILSLQKVLFDLRLTRASNRKLQSHLFSHTKRRIAQLQFKRNQLSR